MDTPSIEKNIKMLENEVDQYCTTKKSFTNSLSLSFLNKNYILYGSFPILLFIILLFYRPNFIYAENEKGERKLSLKKLFLTVLILSLIVSISIFAYRYKKST
jgi:hypothetical protein